MTDSLGRTLADEYEIRGLEPPEPDIPEVASHLWDWFWRLSSRRSHGMESPNPISYLEINSFASITGNTVRPEEADIIVAMDGTYLSAISKRRKEIQEKDREFNELHEKAKAKFRRK